MKKILYTASRASHITNFHLPYIEWFKTIGYSVDVAAQGMMENKLIDKSYSLEFAKNIFMVSNISTVLKLAKIISDNDYDVIICNATLASFITRIACIFSKSNPRIITICHGYLFSDTNSIKSKLYLLCEKMLAKCTDLLLVMNKVDLDIATKYKLGKKISFIDGMGISPTDFPATNSQKNTFTFLCVGEFSNRKNQTFLIHSFAKIIKDGCVAKLIFAGDGVALSSCEELVHTLGISKYVSFLGYVHDVSSLYSTCSCVVSTSKSEGLPFNIMESLLSNVPTIASNVKGHSDLIENGENGILFSLSNQSELENILQTLINDDEYYRTLKQNTKLAEKFMLENTYPKIIKEFSSILGS